MNIDEETIRDLARQSDIVAPRRLLGTGAMTRRDFVSRMVALAASIREVVVGRRVACYRDLIEFA